MEVVTMNVGLYARVSTHDQQTLPLQLEALRTYAEQRRWKIVAEVQETASGATSRPQREDLLKSARRRDLDAILVWKLDRWGRSLADLIVTLKELTDLGVGFVSLTEALDFSTPSGRALAGLLAVFAEFERDLLRERIIAGIAQARKHGKSHGRPRSAAKKADEVRRLFSLGMSKSEIARQVGIGRTSVIRILAQESSTT
jgi:DNA invertase Pin-like site-specific DNA recombinase